jgi:hypothetical protein
MYLYGAGGHSKVMLRYWKVWVKLYTVSLMTINALKKLGGQRSKRDTDFGRKYLPVLESPVIISIGNM